MNAPLKRTKIIATVGPASNTKEMLLQFAIAGANVLRLNFSHGSHEDHLKVINIIKEINKEFNYNLAAVQDLQGPKIRIGNIVNGEVEIVPGKTLYVSTEEELEGNENEVSTTYQNFVKDVKVGDKIMIDDGKLQLQVEEVDGKKVKTKVIVGGMLKSRKGINLPDTQISESCLTKKDLADLEFGLKHNIDWVAISFVRSRADIDQLKSIIKERGKKTRVIAKIERPEALKEIDGIIDAADAIMVARGDLGVETAISELPIVQRSIMKKCFKKAKPVIIATQMLESMITSPIPTRAEANDVAVAVMDGADAVMLSAESAAGKFPLEAVKCMSEIIRSIELNDEGIYEKDFSFPEGSEKEFISKEVIHSACIMAKATNAKAIIGLTESGFTAFNLASQRPKAKIFMFSKEKDLVPALNLIWGVRAFYLPKYESIMKSFANVEKVLLKEGCLEKGDRVITVGTVNAEDKLKTNLVKVGHISE
ncbi:pyruvate kinase [Aureibacter tunicatorum]|uniref:Pyruvate kinase n=1 Tax=Aureibacter tunicatorum TaxID=866807 RepID=A0AAE4BPM2_9BACT|nr:pyruvate kinase [Aureibacter tunicatorum]MDR6238134.1 pyruvate kinase [Aureibacter tunicatorum]BDD03167.1 pyruvate kinase [Aureibacter tunicatorum]